MSLLIQRQNNHDNQSVLGPQQSLVGTWQIDNRKVTLFKEDDHLVYEIFEDHVIKRDVLSPDLIKLYGMSRAIKLIEIFHEVIKVNLAKQVSSQAFLPVLCTEGFVTKKSNGKEHNKAIGLQIALFGQFAPPSPGETSRKIIGAFWGIFNPVGRIVSHKKVDAKSGEALSFLLNVPLRSGEQVYADYAKRFKPILTDNKFTSIALRYISIYDPNVVLDEQNWSITILSASHHTGLKSVGFRANLGHSMIAIEGIKNGCPFIQYAHITTRKLPGFDDNRKRNEARVEIIKDKVFNDITPGKTWIRPKNTVIKMLKYIENEQTNKHYVTFSMTRGSVGNGVAMGAMGAIGVSIAGFVKLSGLEAALPALNLSTFFGPLILPSLSAIGGILGVGAIAVIGSCAIAIMAVGIQHAENAIDDNDNCASWVIKQLERGGIQLLLTDEQDVLGIFKLSNNADITISPNGLIKAINSGKIKVRTSGSI